MSIYDDVMSMPVEERTKLLDSLDSISEADLEERFCSMLRECHGETVTICGYDYDTVTALRAVDPIAYRCGFSDYLGTDDSVTEVAGAYYATDDLDAAYSDWLDREQTDEK